MIYIVGLGAGDESQLTLGVVAKLKSGLPLFLRTAEHPMINFLNENGIEYRAFDDIYMKHETFEAVYEEIIETIKEEAKKGDLIYATPGHPCVAEYAVKRLVAETEAVILGGQSFLDPMFAALFLPLLLNFGLLEFAGTLLSKIMRPVFNLPGRSAIDCLASWLGDGTIGVLLTSKQYEEGFYTKREAAVIGTTFSLVSITFSLVVINTVGLGNMFVPFYFTVTVASLVAAIVLPKLPPLSRKEDTLYDGTPKVEDEKIPAGFNSFSHGFSQAVDQVKSQDLFKVIFVDGFKNVLDMWLAVIPIVMAVGTIALVVAEYTPIFKILGLPFLPVLMLLQIPEAMAASQTLVAGFADMLLPSVLASGIESELTRFVIASVSVCQLIYLSEVGALLLASKIPVNLKELFIIFIQRTLITLPVIALIAHLIF